MALDWEQLQAIAQSATSGYGAADSAFVLSVNAADGGYFAVPAAFDGEVLDYYAQSVANNEREIGKGAYTASARSIARADVDITRSTNSDNRVAFSAAPIVVVDWTGRLFKLLDSLLNVTGSGTAAGAKTALGLADSDINALIDTRVAALQASGQLPPDPSGAADGTLIQVSTGAYTVLT